MSKYKRRRVRVPVPKELRLAVFRLIETVNPNDARMGTEQAMRQLGISRDTAEAILSPGGLILEETLESVTRRLEAIGTRKAS